MKASELRQSILQTAVQGQLVPQDPNDEPASELLKRIQQEKAQLIRDGKIKKNKPLRPINDDEVPYDLPDGWTWCRLGEIILSAKDGPHFSPQYQQNGIPFVSARNITPKGIDFTTAKFISVELHEELSKRCKPEKGDILYTKGGVTGVATVNSYDINFNVWVHVAVLKMTGIINAEWLRNTLNSPHCYDLSQLYTHGTGNRDLGLTRMILITIPLPPLDEQHRIVAKVEELMVLCDELEAAEKELDALEDHFSEYLPKSILQAAVQGKLVEQDSRDEPASELLKRIQREKARLVKEGKVKKEKPLSPIGEDEVPYDLPNGWVWCRLGDVIELVSGRDLEPFQYNDNMNGIPYITGASAIEDDSILINRWTTMPVVVSQSNDILLSCKGTVGKIVLNTIGDCHIARQIMAIRVFSDNLECEYIKLFIHSYVVQLNSKAKSIIPGVSRDNVLFALFPLPPLAEQHRIVVKLNELMMLCDELKLSRTSVAKIDLTNVIPLPQQSVEDEYEDIAMAARGDGAEHVSDKLRKAIDDWDDEDE